MSAARGPYERLSAVAILVGIAVWGVAVRAAEPADRGISLSAWVGGAVDRSVTAADGGRRVKETAAVFGATGLGNIERVAVGGALDATPAALGNARLSLSALAGYEPQVGRTRLLLLAEGGARRFSQVGGGPPGQQLSPDTWLPFVGARLGAARTVPAHGLLELGVWVFGRQDLGQRTVASMNNFLGEETPAAYRLGGFMTGLAVQVGMRLESPHPWNQGVVEP